MNAEMDRPRLEVDSSVVSLFDKSILQTAMWPVAGFVETAQKSGYRGLEWHPLRRIAPGFLMNTGLVSQDSKDAIISLHQSYRGEKSLKEAWEHPSRGFATMSYLLFPERVNSLDNLERLQNILGKELPIVLYPSAPGEESGTDRHFSEKMFQPKPEVMSRWNVKTVEGLIEKAEEEEYTGLCVDLFHMRAQDVDGVGLNPWQETLPQLLPYAQEIHIAAGRVDIDQRHIDTEQELKDLMVGRGETDILKMLQMVRKSGWTGRVVTEIPAVALHNLRADRTRFSSVEKLIEDHKRIVGNIQDLLA